jgi:hypothetical protein
LDLLDCEAMVSGKALDLFQGYRVHPAAGRRRPASQADGEQTTGPDQCCSLAKGALSLRWWDVLPDSGHQHHIEADPQPAEHAQFGELVANPADTRVGMKALPLRAHATRRLNSDHVIALGGEPSGIAS